MLLPRIYMILAGDEPPPVRPPVERVFPGQWERIGHMAMLAYGQVHMANLCVAVFAHGERRFPDSRGYPAQKDLPRLLHMMQPDKFLGITNGITHRRWLMQANPGLAHLLDETIGVAWRKEPAHAGRS